MTILSGIFDAISTDEILGSLTWALVIGLIVTGFLGTFLPILPGTTFIFAGTLLHYFLLGMEASGLAWQGLVFITIVYSLSLIVDWFSGAIGAKWFGSSKWGVIGAIAGGIVGLFFGLPGLILGPFLGAVLGEWTLRRQIVEAGRAGAGAWLGIVLGAAAKMALIFVMLGLFVTAYFF